MKTELNFWTYSPGELDLDSSVMDNLPLSRAVRYHVFIKNQKAHWRKHRKVG